VQSLVVIHGLDESRNVFQDIFDRLVFRQVYLLGFQCFEPALHERVVIAVPLGGHACSDPVLCKQTAIGVARVLHASIRVMNEPGPGPALFDRTPEGCQAEFAIQS